MKLGPHPAEEVYDVLLDHVGCGGQATSQATPPNYSLKG